MKSFKIFRIAVILMAIVTLSMFYVVFNATSNYRGSVLGHAGTTGKSIPSDASNNLSSVVGHAGTTGKSIPSDASNNLSSVLGHAGTTGKSTPSDASNNLSSVVGHAGTTGNNEQVLNNQTTVNNIGFILSLAFTDQVTFATAVLQGLMCLATQLGGVRVIEPFIVDSYLGLNVSADWRRELRFRDLFDISVWEREISEKHYHQLVPFADFIEAAPRKVLIVQHHCSGIKWCLPCGHEDVFEKGRIFCRLNNFELVGHVCIKYNQKKYLTVKDIERQIYSDYSKSEVVLLFHYYGGMFSGRYSAPYSYRLFVQETKCLVASFHNSDFSFLYPSQLVQSAAENYIQKYLNGSVYISVMVRMEVILMKAKQTKLNTQSKKNFTEQCLNYILEKCEQIKKETGITQVFLTHDIGTYGSDTFRSEDLEITKITEAFMSRYFNKHTTIAEWEDTFLSVSASRVTAMIAILQKTVAVRGEVLILAGLTSGSSFQRSSKYIYQKVYKKQNLYELEGSCSD